MVGNADGPNIESFNSSPATCNDANGTAILAPAAYSYEWSDGEDGSIRTGLSAGIYQVTLTDPSNGCFNVIEVEIESFNPLTADVQINNLPQCGGTDGMVSINIGGGSGNYTVDWSGWWNGG